MPKPVPTPESLELKGLRPHVSRAAAPVFQGGRPTCPKYLSEVARQEWRRMVREQIKRGTATKIDASVLELYCETYARVRACRDEIGNELFVDVPVLDSNGQFVGDKRVPNPALSTLEKAESAARQLLVTLGATPASRTTRQLTREGRKKNEPPKPGSFAEMLANAEQGE